MFDFYFHFDYALEFSSTKVITEGPDPKTARELKNY